MVFVWVLSDVALCNMYFVELWHIQHFNHLYTWFEVIKNYGMAHVSIIITCILFFQEFTGVFYIKHFL